MLTIKPALLPRVNHGTKIKGFTMASYRKGYLRSNDQAGGVEYWADVEAYESGCGPDGIAEGSYSVVGSMQAARKEARRFITLANQGD